MSRTAAAGVFVAVAVGVYFLLIFAALIAGGGAVSCEQSCTRTQDFLSDAYPLPMFAAIAVSLIAGTVVAWRVRPKR